MKNVKMPCGQKFCSSNCIKCNDKECPDQYKNSTREQRFQFRMKQSKQAIYDTSEDFSNNGFIHIFIKNWAILMNKHQLQKWTNGKSF